jgi:hypothetical protein
MPLVEEAPFGQAVDICVTREPELWDPMSPALKHRACLLCSRMATQLTIFAA